MTCLTAPGRSIKGPTSRALQSKGGKAVAKRCQSAVKAVFETCLSRHRESTGESPERQSWEGVPHLPVSDLSSDSLHSAQHVSGFTSACACKGHLWPSGSVPCPMGFVNRDTSLRCAQASDHRHAIRIHQDQDRSGLILPALNSQGSLTHHLR